ncbi:protein Lines homolog 1 [Pelobates fuscus]|uniref:protein Lines homolog 1 n=1 Tax=Pelobates fuscus TaxID=191477 RepID=UPI002FE46915
MEDLFPFLRKLYRIVLQTAPLHEDLQKCATLLVPQIPDATLESLVCKIKDSSPWCQRDVTLLQLSLIQMLVLKAGNSDTEPGVRCQYTHLVELLQQADVASAIIKLSDTPEKVLSYLSSKCLSCLVLYHLKCQNEVNIPWLQFCLKTLREYPECHTVLPCLMSMIGVFKGILKDENYQQADNLMKRLGPFHPLFETFCTSVLSVRQCQPLILESPSIYSCLLDLLEILTAVRIVFKLPSPLCQQVFSLSLPQALSVVSSSLPYFVKKQVILVLKKCLLHKAGEDFLLSTHLSSPMSDPLSEQDMTILAEALLSAVSEGWLLQVPVTDKPSSFGGAIEATKPSPDLVILGAVSLSVLKSLEVKVHTTFSSTDTDSLQTIMGHLLVFLKPHLGSIHLTHPCEWVSLTFIEQDDDLLEVAKCLLNMYIYCHSNLLPVTKCLEDKIGIWDSASHQMGCNPHCIFLLLLKNVAFDDSVLLDFLISSETCFLEYFVRYLKFLREDWHQFCLTCSFFDKATPNIAASLNNDYVSVQSEVVGNYSSHANVQSSILKTTSSQVSMSAGNGIHSATCSSIEWDYYSSLNALQRLVAYDSSEGSDTESLEKEQASLREQVQDDDRSDTDKQDMGLEPMATCPDINHTPMAMDHTHQMLGTKYKFVRCLGELQDAIHRMQRKRLFPYNPSALLKLLTQISDLNRDAD